MSSKLSYSNRKFNAAVDQIRKIMPILAISLLVFVYVVSAIVEGVLLQGLMANIWYGGVLAFLILSSIQATRCLLVFFSQLNPNRPDFSRNGEVIAVVMGLFAIGSILGLVNEVGMAVPVAVSLALLMAAGILIEIRLLKEIRYATEKQLGDDPAALQDIASFHQRRKELKAKLELIDATNSDPSTEEIEHYRQQLLAPPTPAPNENKNTGAVSNLLLRNIALAKLDERQAKFIEQLLEAGTDEVSISAYVNQFAFDQSAAKQTIPQQEAKEVERPLELNGVEFSLNGAH